VAIQQPSQSPANLKKLAAQLLELLSIQRVDTDSAILFSERFLRS
jgi:hypothetical protein